LYKYCLPNVGEIIYVGITININGYSIDYAFTWKKTFERDTPGIITY